MCHLHTASAAAILEKVGLKVQLSKGPSKIVLAQKWGGRELRSRGSAAVPQTSLLPIVTTHCLGQFSAPYPQSRGKEKPCCTPERVPPTDCSCLWAGFINLVSC